MNVKTEFDAAAEALKQAARDNAPGLCERFYGSATAGNIFVNAAALRIAAENKSYEAFEQMLEIAGAAACGATSVYSIGLGPDWEKVNEIAQGDDRIRASLRRYEEQVDTNINEMFALMEEEVSDEAQPAEMQTSGTSFFSKLKFW